MSRPFGSAASSAAAASSNSGSRLADFLRSQNQALVDDLRAGKGKGWHIAMGNEAGDLDTIASSVAFSYLASALDADRTAALILTPPDLMRLRPENMLALDRAKIPLDALLHVSQLPVPTTALAAAGVRFDLVDHNTLLPLFGPVAETADTVDAIVDHHDDEGSHPNAGSRLIRVPTGSSSSLVTEHFRSRWAASISGPAGVAGSPVPPELATLLLSAILIDTHGLKRGGKAVDADYAAAAFLYPLSTLGGANATTIAALSTDSSAEIPSALEAFSNELVDTKYDVTGMSTADLLQRDYKQYAFDTKSGSPAQIAVGLSTVPVSLVDQLAQDGGWTGYLAQSETFMANHGLDALGVLTTYKSKKKNKSRREILLLVRAGGSLSTADAARVRDTLVTGLEATGPLLDLKPWGAGAGSSSDKPTLAADGAAALSAHESLTGYIWDQKNHRSTRKQVAPAVRDVLEGM